MLSREENQLLTGIEPGTLISNCVPAETLTMALRFLYSEFFFRQ